MATITDRQKQIAAAIAAAGVYATDDPREAGQHRPCVLVGPPTLDWAAGTAGAPLLRWNVYALAAGDDVRDLDEFIPLLDAVNTACRPETATPAAYPLTAGRPPVPCYQITFTT